MLAGIKAGGENKNANNWFQGTLHKVSGPLNRDVEPKTIVRLREIATAAATEKIHLAGV